MRKETKKLKIGLYSPYLHILGGGERYLLSIAEVLSYDNDIYIFSDKQIKKKAKENLDIFLEKVHFLEKSILQTRNLFKKYSVLCRFDLFFFMTDGSIFFPFSKKNYLIIQSPVHTPSVNFFNEVKLRNWRVLCYSQFMKNILKKRVGIEAKILSPCIGIDKFRTSYKEKENLILSVGRFFPFPHNKKHDVLVEIFRKNYQRLFTGWKLVIAGIVSEAGGKKVLDELRKKIKGYPIEIATDLSFARLLAFYKKAKIYWHATGFGENIENFPERAEHFGITTLEAMAAGVIPVVFNAGGQKDIVEDGQSGYLWNTEIELVGKTHKLIHNNNLQQEMSKRAISRARDFSCKSFYEKLQEIIKG